MKKFIKGSLLTLSAASAIYFVVMFFVVIWVFITALKSCSDPGPFYSESTDPNEYLTFELLEDDTYSVTGFKLYPVENLVIPSEHEGKVVSEIADDAFMSRRTRYYSRYNKYGYIKTVVIPDTIKKIGCRAFYEREIENYYLPDSIEIIEDEAFGSNTLGKINVPNNIKKIGYRAFYNKNIGEELYLDDVELEDYSFCGVNVKKVIFSDKFTEIQDGLFSDSSIEEIILPDNCEKIGCRSFYKCKLINITFGENVSYIGEYAFYNNPLTNIDFNSNNIELDSYSFASIDTELNLNFNCEDMNIDYKAFYATDNIAKIDLNDNNERYKLINGALCTKQNTLRIAPKDFNSFDNIKSIGAYAFACRKIDELTIPENVEINSDAFESAKIDKIEVNSSNVNLYAFKYANIEQLSISTKIIEKGAFGYVYDTKKLFLLEGVEIVESDNFSRCYSLEVILLPSTLKKIEDNSFVGCQRLKTIYYNLGSGEPANLSIDNFRRYDGKRNDKRVYSYNSDLIIYVSKDVYDACKKKWKYLPREYTLYYDDEIIEYLVIWEE